MKSGRFEDNFNDKCDDRYIYQKILMQKSQAQPSVVSGVNGEFMSKRIEYSYEQTQFNSEKSREIIYQN